jgi:para-nitrobenzyl esterase
MKKIYLLIFTGLFTSFSYGQCIGGRYASDVFTSVDITSDIVYGSNITNGGDSFTLDMDIYEPTGDNETARPLIIWAHGGSFISGSKTDNDVVTLADRFVKKGYVFASINYRLGINWPFNQNNATKAVVRAVQDMKASIRFFYEDRATTDTYKIDTTKIYIGGTSAGAITALHLAYLDQECEILEFISTSELNDLGGIEGTSGYAGYSTEIQGVISLAGALASYGWIETGDVPLCSTHGTNDGIVQYNRGFVSVFGANIMELDGSRVIKEQADAIGVQNNFYSHYGADHVPHSSSTAYMDTTVNFIRDFLIDQMGCTDVALQAPNTPFGTADLYPITYCNSSIAENNEELINSIYPNPSSDDITISFNEIGEKEIKVMDIAGRVIRNENTSDAYFVIERNGLKVGTYIVQINMNGSYSTSKVVFE